jgi:predicted enzyme related to lactoylglutathione lyase
MTSKLFAVSIDANDPAQLGRFWSELLGWESAADDLAGGVMIRPDDENGYRIRFQPTRQPKSGPNTIHFDLTSRSLEDQREIVDRALALGGQHIDIGQTGDEGHVVLADPEGNEFCVIEPDNKFLAGTGVIGAVNCEGTQALGYFWSEALGWPLVWDQDEETAIQTPHGGSKITWSGPPLLPRNGRIRMHFDLVTPAGGDLRAEVERLIALGAAPTQAGPSEVDWVVLTDVDGNEFCVLPPR